MIVQFLSNKKVQLKQYPVYVQSLSNKKFHSSNPAMSFIIWEVKYTEVDLRGSVAVADIDICLKMYL